MIAAPQCVDTIRRRAASVLERADKLVGTDNDKAQAQLMAEAAQLRVLLREPQCHLPDCQCSMQQGPL